MIAVAHRHLDAGDVPDVEARFIVQQDDVRELGGRAAGAFSRELEAVGGRGVRLQKSLAQQPGDRIGARAGERGDIVLVAEGLAVLQRKGNREGGQRGQANGHAG